jgi:SAM-dependent methyltransferase
VITLRNVPQKIRGWQRRKLVSYDDQLPIIVEMSAQQAKARNLLLRALATGEIRVASRVCPVCGNGKSELFANFDRYGLPIEMVLCDSCPTMYNKTIPDSQGLKLFYSEIYRDLHSPQPPMALYEEQSEMSHVLLNQLTNLRVAPTVRFSKVLDVGSGSGGLVHAFREVGAQTFVLDPGSDFLETARENGHIAISTMLEDFSESTTFGIVIARDVLEHAREPRRFMRNLHRILDVGGLAYVQVPTLNHLELLGYRNSFRRYLQFAHLTNFTDESFDYLLTSEGFEVVSTPRIGARWVRARTSRDREDLTVCPTADVMRKLIDYTQRNHLRVELKHQVVARLPARVRAVIGRRRVTT